MKYDTLVQSRLTKDQERDLHQLAEAEGLSVASYIRRMIIKEIHFAKHGVDGWPAELREIKTNEEREGEIEH